VRSRDAAEMLDLRQARSTAERAELAELAELAEKASECVSREAPSIAFSARSACSAVDLLVLRVMPGPGQPALCRGGPLHACHSRMITRADIIWLGVSAGVIGSLVGGMMLGIGMSMVINVVIVFLLDAFGNNLGTVTCLPGAATGPIEESRSPSSRSYSDACWRILHPNFFVVQQKLQKNNGRGQHDPSKHLDSEND